MKSIFTHAFVLFYQRCGSTNGRKWINYKI